MVLVPDFPKLYKFCRPHIYIFEKLYSQRKKLYEFGTLCFGLKFICNGISTKMYNFFQSYTISVLPISIFLKSCTTKEKRCTALLHCRLCYTGLKFICNAICTKMYNIFQSCTNSVVPISIFLKSFTMIKKLYKQRKAPQL